MPKLIKLFNSRQNKTFIILLVLITIVSILEMTSLAIIVPIINLFLEIETNPKENSLIWISKIIQIDDFSILSFLLLFIIFFSVKTLLSIFVSRKHQNFIYDFVGKIAYNLFSKYLSQDYKKYSLKNSSELMRNLLREIDLFNLYLQSFMHIILESIILFGIIIFLLYLLTIPTVIIIIFSFIIFIIYYFIVKKNLFEWGKDRQLIEKDRITYMQETFSSIKEINFFNRNNFFLNRFYKKNKKFYKITSNFNFLNSIPRYIFELFTIIIILIVFSYLVIIGSPNENVLKTIAIFLAASFRIIPSVYRIFGSTQNLNYTRVSFNILYEDYKSLKKKEQINESSNLVFKDKINLQIKNFSHVDESNFKIKNISLEIKKNQKIGIIGRSGSGKSSLIDILTGIIFESHCIKLQVDQKLIKTEIDRHNWQKKIGLIPQNISILNSSLKENILFGLDEARYTDKEILNILSVSNLSLLLNRLPNGLNYKIKEKGTNFSGGEIQRIGIARALIINPDILIFDEATSALDTFTENEILKDINLLKNKTIIMISHRMNTLKYCDKIYLMDKGEIIDSGSYDKFNEKY